MRRTTIPVVVAILPLAGAAPAADWAIRLPLTDVRPGVVQRVELPAAAILALRRADGGDVRVVDARGRAQAMARLPIPAPAERRLPLTPLPILGAVDALTVTGVTLRVDAGRARIVRLDGSPAGGGGQALLGVLLDTSGVDAAAQAVTLDVDTPASQPVTLMLESSSDLSHWSAESERVVFRTGGRRPVTLPLAGTALRGRMLRVTWRADGRLMAPVEIAGATLRLAGSADAGRIGLAAVLPPLGDRHHIDFTMPIALVPAAVRVETAAGTTPTPVALFGRADREQDWAPIGSGVAAAGGPPIAVAGQYPEWRIAAAADGEGFDAAPRLQLRFDPVAYAFLASGAPPFSLVAGRADAASSAVSLATLNGMAAGVGGSMPRVSVGASPPEAMRLAPITAGASARNWLLWGVLLLGVALLAAMVWALTRQRAPDA